MINTNTLARPYAKAAFEFASAAQQADAWLNMLSLSAAAVQTPAVAQQLVNPALTDEQKVNVLAQICAGHLDVEVESAFELNAEQLQTLAAALSKRLDRTVQPKPVVNPALIGGVVIRAGDLVIDGSVRGKLNKLAEALKS